MDSFFVIMEVLYFVIIVVLIAIGVIVGKKRAGKSLYKPGTPVRMNTMYPSNPPQPLSRRGQSAMPDFLPRYSAAEQPETGYVILNGIKRKLRDCRNL